MSWLTEDPTLLLVIGGLVLAMLAVAFVKTGRVVVLLWALLVAAMVGVGALIEQVIVTPREEVEQTIEAVRLAFLANSEADVLAHISSDAGGLQQQVGWAFRTIEVTEAKITDGPKIDVNPYNPPPSATAELIGSVKGRVRNDSVEHRIINKFIVRFSKRGDRWLIDEVKHELPFGNNQSAE
ncbi:MAG: hypothetical protein WBF93_02310 [Pirellulales bacterium]|nr:hypothetical protein [Pirellulales bacterium]